MTRMICLRASSDCKRLTKHENTGLGWVIAASRSVCDTPVKVDAAASRNGLHFGGDYAPTALYRSTSIALVRRETEYIHEIGKSAQREAVQ